MYLFIFDTYYGQHFLYVYVGGEDNTHYKIHIYPQIIINIHNQISQKEKDQTVLYIYTYIYVWCLCSAVVWTY